MPLFGDGSHLVCKGVGDGSWLIRKAWGGRLVITGRRVPES